MGLEESIALIGSKIKERSDDKAEEKAEAKARGKAMAKADGKAKCKAKAKAESKAEAKAKGKAKAAPEAKGKAKAAPKCKAMGTFRPHFNVERTRSGVQCRTGLKGPGQSYRIAFDTAGGEAAAIRQAEAWVAEQNKKAKKG